MSTTPDHDAVRQAAERLIDAAAHRVPCAPVRDLIGSADAATSAYTVQRAANAARPEQRPVGRKAVDPAIVAERDGGICYLWGEPVTAKSGRWGATLDHVRPASRGGERSYANVRLAHRSCNSRKCDSII
jgi:HNH endonuclease